MDSQVSDMVLMVTTAHMDTKVSGEDQNTRSREESGNSARSSEVSQLTTKSSLKLPSTLIVKNSSRNTPPTRMFNPRKSLKKRLKRELENLPTCWKDPTNLWLRLSKPTLTPNAGNSPRLSETLKSRKFQSL